MRDNVPQFSALYDEVWRGVLSASLVAPRVAALCQDASLAVRDDARVEQRKESGRRTRHPRELAIPHIRRR